MFNVWVAAPLSWWIGVGVFAWLEPILGLWGFAGLLLIPVGLVEIFTAEWVLTGGSRAPLRHLRVLQWASLAIGGVASAWYARTTAAARVPDPADT